MALLTGFYVIFVQYEKMIDQHLATFIREQEFGTYTEYFKALQVACQENKKYESYVQSILAVADYGTLPVLEPYSSDVCICLFSPLQRSS